MQVTCDADLLQEEYRKRLLLGLDWSQSALFDSDEVSRNESPCLKGTRIDILNKIQDWTESPEAEPIYWLHGMAGTGKTSVALTVAKALNARQPFAGNGIGRVALNNGVFLGASFFFKQGDATRNSTKTFFTTIAKRLAQEVPNLMVYITDSISKDLEIGFKSWYQQFSNLIAKPLYLLDRDTFIPIRLIVNIVEALDECINPTESEEMISMLEDIGDLHQVQLRVLITAEQMSISSRASKGCLVPCIAPRRLEKFRIISSGRMIG